MSAAAATIVPIPSVLCQRAWLDREALRIVAGVRAATVDNVIGVIWRGHMIAGVDRGAAEADVKEVLAYLTVRMEQIAALLSDPAPHTGRGRRHG